jgi:hypothetical protein
MSEEPAASPATSTKSKRSQYGRSLSQTWGHKLKLKSGSAEEDGGSDDPKSPRGRDDPKSPKGGPPAGQALQRDMQQAELVRTRLEHQESFSRQSLDVFCCQVKEALRLKKEREKASKTGAKQKSSRQSRFKSKDPNRRSVSQTARELAERYAMLTAEQIEKEMEQIKDPVQLEARLKEMQKKILSTPVLTAEAVKPRPAVDSHESSELAELNGIFRLAFFGWLK